MAAFWPIETALIIRIVSYPIRKKSRFWIFCMWSVKEMYHAVLPKTDYRDKGRGRDCRLRLEGCHPDWVCEYGTLVERKWTGSLFGEKNSEERERKVGERACRQTFEAAIPPSCNYPADHLSVRSLSVNQFRVWVTPGKINRKFSSIWKQSEMEHEPHCRFCKKSLISGKRINKPFVLLVWFVI